MKKKRNEKAVALFAALVMCLSLCACGQSENEKIEEQLQAGWIDEAPLSGTDYIVIYSYIFGDGKVTGGVDVYTGGTTNLTLTRSSGTYKLSDGKVIIDWTDHDFQSEDTTLHLIPDSEFTYTYNDETLTLVNVNGQAELTRQEIG